jgi:hypothetical protein
MATVKKPVAKKPVAKKPANPREAALAAELKRQNQGKRPAKGYTYGKNVGP